MEEELGGIYQDIGTFYLLHMIRTLSVSTRSDLRNTGYELYSNHQQNKKRLQEEYGFLTGYPLLNANYLFTTFKPGFTYLNNSGNIVKISMTIKKEHRDQLEDFLYRSIYRAYAGVLWDIFLTNTYGEIFDTDLALRSIRDEKGTLGYDSQKLDPFVWGLLNGFSPYYFERFPESIQSLKMRDPYKASTINFTLFYTSHSFYWSLCELQVSKYLLQDLQFFEGFRLYRPALSQDRLEKLSKAFEYGFIERSVSILTRNFKLWETLKRLSPEEFAALHNDRQWGRYFDILVFNLMKSEHMLKRYARDVTELIERDCTQGLLKENLPFRKFLAAFTGYEAPWPVFYRESYPSYDFSTGVISETEIKGLEKRILNIVIQSP